MKAPNSIYILLFALASILMFSTDASARNVPPPGKLVWNLDLLGGDLKTVSLGRFSSQAANQCKTICLRNSKCVAVVTKRNRQCVLKQRIGTARGATSSGVWVRPKGGRTPAASNVTPPKPGQTLANTDLIGGNFWKTWPGRKIDTCRRICKSHNKCVAGPGPGPAPGPSQPANRCYLWACVS